MLLEAVHRGGSRSLNCHFHVPYEFRPHVHDDCSEYHETASLSLGSQPGRFGPDATRRQPWPVAEEAEERRNFRSYFRHEHESGVLHR